MQPRIEPASPGDLPIIEEAVQRMKLDGERLEIEQFVVARGEGRLLGFGRIKPYGDGVYELGTVGVLEEARGRGVGALLVEALIERFPSEEVWITTDLTTYFERFGFAPSPAAPPAIVSKLERICGSLRSGVVAMSRRRGGRS